MTQYVLVPGYGVPPNILVDGNYRHYLSSIINRLFDLSRKHPHDHLIIVCAGGPTDMRRPYRRTEGREMVRLAKHLTAQQGLRDVAKHWTWIAETRSLSTLENLLFFKRFVRSRRATVRIAMEWTRQSRFKKISPLIFPGYQLKYLPIDFDISPNRYLDPKFLAKKEQAALRWDTWALKSPANLHQHHTLFSQKLRYLRQASKNRLQTEAVRTWWEKQLVHPPT